MWKFIYDRIEGVYSVFGVGAGALALGGASNYVATAGFAVASGLCFIAAAIVISAKIRVLYSGKKDTK